MTIKLKPSYMEWTPNELADALRSWSGNREQLWAAANMLQDQAQEVEKLKKELAMVKAASNSYETWWIRYRDMAVDLDKELRELLRKVNEK